MTSTGHYDCESGETKTQTCLPYTQIVIDEKAKTPRIQLDHLLAF